MGASILTASGEAGAPKEQVEVRTIQHLPDLPKLAAEVDPSSPAAPQAPRKPKWIWEGTGKVSCGDNGGMTRTFSHLSSHLYICPAQRHPQGRPRQPSSLPKVTCLGRGREGLQPPLSGPTPRLLLPLHAFPGSLTQASTQWLRSGGLQCLPLSKTEMKSWAAPGTVLAEGSGSY